MMDQDDEPCARRAERDVPCDVQDLVAFRELCEDPMHADKRLATTRWRAEMSGVALRHELKALLLVIRHLIELLLSISGPFSPMTI